MDARPVQKTPCQDVHNVPSDVSQNVQHYSRKKAHQLQASRGVLSSSTPSCLSSAAGQWQIPGAVGGPPRGPAGSGKGS